MADSREVSFQFTLKAEEAEDLFDLVREAAIEAFENSSREDLTDAERSWWKERAIYLAEIPAKMRNSMVYPV